MPLRVIKTQSNFGEQCVKESTDSNRAAAADPIGGAAFFTVGTMSS